MSRIARSRQDVASESIGSLDGSDDSSQRLSRSHSHYFVAVVRHEGADRLADNGKAIRNHRSCSNQCDCGDFVTDAFVGITQDDLDLNI